MDFSINFKDLIDDINDYIKRVYSDELTDEEREEIKKEMLKMTWTKEEKTTQLLNTEKQILDILFRLNNGTLTEEEKELMEMAKPLADVVSGRKK